MVNVRGGLRVFSDFFLHSEGHTPRNEALMEAVVNQARTTRHQWLINCETEKEEMREQQRMKVMKDMTRKIRSKGSMDANDSWWFGGLLAADRAKAWPHPEREDNCAAMARLAVRIEGKR